MEQRLPRRRKMRLPEYDYSSAGYYFITICTKDKRCFFGKIVGRADSGAPHPQPASPEKAMRLTAPQFQPTPIGKIVEKYIQSIDQAYSSVSLDQYVIMPNHIHMILRVAYPEDGAPGSSRPTNISGVIGCLKRFTNRDAGENLWQSSYYDHIIRNEADYLRIWTYIENNPAEWGEDPYFEA